MILRMDLTTMEKSYIINTNKGEKIISMTPYTQTDIRRMRQEWLEWRPTPLFIFIFPLLFAIAFTYHGVQTGELNLLTMGERK